MGLKIFKLLLNQLKNMNITCIKRVEGTPGSEMFVAGFLNCI